MKILLLSQWFDPEPTFKGMEFAQELKRRGHDVTVLTGFPNYPTGRLYPGYRMRGFSDNRIDGVRVVRVPLYPSHDANPLHRILTYVSFAAMATAGVLVLPRPDVAYIYHPPASIGLPALALKLLRGVPYVYDVQDLWPDTLAATGMISSQRILNIVGGWMGWVYRAAATIVVQSPGFARLLEKRGVPADRVRVIYNWTFENALAAGSTTASPPGPGERRDDAFRILFAGTIGLAQDLDVVLDAAQLLADEGRFDIIFDLMGGGVDVPRLQQEAKARCLKGVTFLPRREPGQMRDVLARADALLVHLRDNPLFRVTIPSKTQSSLLAGRPILMGVRGDAADIVRQAGAGVTFLPGDAHALVVAAKALAGLSPEERDAMGARGRCFYLSRFSLAAGVDAFEETFRDAAIEPRPRYWARRPIGAVAAVAALAVPLVAAGAWRRRDRGRRPLPDRGGNTVADLERRKT